MILSNNSFWGLIHAIERKSDSRLTIDCTDFFCIFTSQVGKYYCVVDNQSSEEYDFDMDTPGVMERVKEKAKVTRKGLGHRRSHSDFNSRSHKVQQQDVIYI